jgi:hypothetical protein
MLARKALAGTAGAPKEYVEDVFSTYLYTGSGATKTITNDIDLSGEGGMVWIKARSTAYIHCLYDTERGALNTLTSNTTDASISESGSLTAFNADGFTLGSFSQVNHSSNPTYVAWTFRQAKKFFDVVTYTGTGSARTVAHNLGSVPGCIIVKRTDSSTFWAVYHTSLGNTKVIFLNDTDLAATSSAYWNNTSPTSTNFTVGTDSGVNANGGTYVAYLFAHDAGGFGASGSDNVIKCGSVVGSSNVEVNLGWEPQWLLVKNASAAQDWWIVDNMRGLPVQATDSSYSASALRPNLTDAETTGFSIAPLATGFKANVLTSSQTYIYIAIRRGPMKTPTSATDVYKPIAYTGNGSTRTQSVGWPIDLSINMNRGTAGDAPTWNDRLRGTGVDLYSNGAGAEAVNGSAGVQFDNQTNLVVPNYRITNGSTYIDWVMRRAPGFFDVVCYTGNATDRTISHNLGVAPELMIVKDRTTSGWGWAVYSSSLGATKWLQLELTNAVQTSSAVWNDTTPTSSVFSVGVGSYVNRNADNFVAYLFASVTGVSKVGSYTGNGSSQTINCGFTGGARLVLIKRTDSTGNWVTFDTARGIVSGNDPALYLNSTAAEVTGVDGIDPDNSGFIVNQETTFNLNVNNATYIFYAVA